jgi:Activator of Hsp90 ATPase homolog 1-like protein
MQLNHKRHVFQLCNEWKRKISSKRDIMQNNDCTVTIEVSKSADIVFRCITKDVAKWWGGKDLEGKSICLNDEFIINHPGSHYSKQKLTKVVPGKKVIWLVTESTMSWLKINQHEWTNTRMIFEIAERGNKTVLRFKHEGLVPEKECYELCAKGWNTVISDYLFNWITQGKPRF